MDKAGIPYSLIAELSGTNPPCQLSHSIDIASMREDLTPARLNTEAVPLSHDHHGDVHIG